MPVLPCVATANPAPSGATGSCSRRAPTQGRLPISSAARPRAWQASAFKERATTVRPAAPEATSIPAIRRGAGPCPRAARMVAVMPAACSLPSASASRIAATTSRIRSFARLVSISPTAVRHRDAKAKSPRSARRGSAPEVTSGTFSAEVPGFPSQRCQTANQDPGGSHAAAPLMLSLRPLPLDLLGARLHYRPRTVGLVSSRSSQWVKQDRTSLDNADCKIILSLRFPQLSLYCC